MQQNEASHINKNQQSANDADEVLAQLQKVRDEVSRRRIADAKNTAKKILGMMQSMHASDAAKEHIDNAIAACDHCLGMPEHEDGHEAILQHIGHAETHMNNAISHQHREHPIKGRHHKPIQIHDIIKGGEHEHPIHH